MNIKIWVSMKYMKINQTFYQDNQMYTNIKLLVYMKINHTFY